MYMLFYNYKELCYYYHARKSEHKEGRTKDEEAAPASPLSTRTDDTIERDE